jgi:hypothetical protein
MNSETKFKQQVRAGGASLAALLFGTAGWLPLVIAAGLAMGDASRSKIVVGLALAGAAAPVWPRALRTRPSSSEAGRD